MPKPQRRTSAVDRRSFLRAGAVFFGGPLLAGIIAVNVGGCLIPAGLAAYEFLNLAGLGSRFLEK